MDDSSEGRLWSLIRKIFSSRSEEEDPVEEIIMEAQEEGDLKHDEVQMLLNVVHLNRKQVYDIMIPRTDMDCAPMTASIHEVAELIISSGHSRVPVYKETKDQILGIVHAKDMLKVLLHPEVPGHTLQGVMRAPFFIPETTNVKQLIVEFQNRKTHLAIVLDEYGGTSGMVTFEDVLEQIVGDIEDEHDSPRPADIQPLEGGGFLVSGRTPLEDLGQVLQLDLTSENIETVGGFVSHLAGRLPRPGESYQAFGHTFAVKDVGRQQIQWLTVQPEPVPSDNPPAP